MLEDVDVQILRKQFEECASTLVAMGSETRLHIVFTMLRLGCEGIRVGELAKHTHLSRATLSHHLRILKNIGIIRLRKDGAKHFYHLDSRQEELQKMHLLLKNIQHIIEMRNQEHE